MNKRSRTKYSVLGMLAFEDQTGYDIAKAIAGSIKYFWAESEGQIYPALAQCVTEGLATCKELPAQNKRLPKKMYSITALGRKELKAWLKLQPQSESVRNELLLKLFFGGHLTEQDNIQHLNHTQDQVENEIATFQTIRQELIKEYPHSPHLKYWLITLDYGIRMSKAHLAWCKESKKLLETDVT